MADITIQAEERQQFGKNVSRRLRTHGRIPAVVYGQALKSTSVVVDSKDLHRILHSETGHNTIFKIQINGNATDVLIKDYQLDPVKGTLLHADFQTVSMDEVMEFEVPIEVLGTARGVQLTGGVLDIVMREIELECLPADVPDHIRVDVSALEIGQAVRVADLQVDTSKIQILSEPTQVVVTVVPPHVEKEPEEVTVEAEAAEPEVLKKGKAEEAEEEGEE
ncbi:MAG: 50S ribosomal protein L25/general stress protein Ctc [Acidobacteriota bacterium]